MDESPVIPEKIRIVVPGEARPYRERTHTFRRRRPGRRGQPVGSIAVGSHMPAAHRNYRDAISAEAGKVMGSRLPIDGPVRLHILAFVPIPRSLPKYRLREARRGLFHPCKTPDLTNVIKLAEDALIGIVFKDDKQVIRQAGDTGRYFSFRPRLEVVVEPVTHCQLQADELRGDDE